MTTGTEALVRRACQFAEGDVLDLQGFTGLFAEDGVFTGIGGPSGPESYRGEHLPGFTSAVAASAPHDNADESGGNP